MPDGGTPNLIEQSLRDALAAISNAGPERVRPHWQCSLRIVCQAIGKPPELIPARITALRLPLSRLHHAPLGISPKTLANHKSNVRAALRWLAKEEGVPSRGAPLSPEWELLRSAISNLRSRSRLSSLMRFASARHIRPSMVDERVIDDFMLYRASTTHLSTNAAARRQIARTWNGCIGVVASWPDQRLNVPPVKARASGPRWHDLPDGLRRDFEAYLSSLEKIRRIAGGKRWRPCLHSTIKARRAMLRAYIGKAVSTGTQLEKICSLRDALNPELVEQVLDNYWKTGNDSPSVYTIDLASLLYSIARQTNCLDKAQLERIEDTRTRLECHRAKGLTEKNRALVREVLSSDRWQLVLRLPWDMMQRARDARQTSPIKAAGLAQMAVAVGILTIFPVRLSNLASIRIGKNLHRPGGPRKPYWLVFPPREVKNRVNLETIFDDQLTLLIDEYIDYHLPILLRGSKEPWLFPGPTGSHKHVGTLSEQVTKSILKKTGLRVTVHQFRHAAAALVLRENPGNYEFVRRLLGHRNVQTTNNFYVGLETAQATTEFGKIIRREMNSGAK